jgi:hypothetical protein
MQVILMKEFVPQGPMHVVLCISRIWPLAPPLQFYQAATSVSCIKEEAEEGGNAIGVTKKITGRTRRFQGDVHVQHDYAGDSTDKQHGNSTI